MECVLIAYWISTLKARIWIIVVDICMFFKVGYFTLGTYTTE